MENGIDNQSNTNELQLQEGKLKTLLVDIKHGIKQKFKEEEEELRRLANEFVESDTAIFRGKINEAVENLKKKGKEQIELLDIPRHKWKVALSDKIEAGRVECENFLAEKQKKLNRNY